MGLDDGTGSPLHDRVGSALLVTGAAALAAQDLPRRDEGFLRRVPLVRSGVLQADGSPHPMGMSNYRNRGFVPASGTPPPDPQARLGLGIFGGIVGDHFGHVLT